MAVRDLQHKTKVLSAASKRSPALSLMLPVLPSAAGRPQQRGQRWWAGGGRRGRAHVHKSGAMTDRGSRRRAPLPRMGTSGPGSMTHREPRRPPPDAAAPSFVSPLKAPTRYAKATPARSRADVTRSTPSRTAFHSIKREIQAQAAADAMASLA